MDPYQRLPAGELLNVLPEEELEELEFLSRTLGKKSSTDTPLSHDKKTLALLYKNLTVERLWDPSFREQLLNGCDLENLRKIAEIAGIDPAMSHAQLSRALARVPWQDSPAARAIIETFGFSPSLLPASSGAQPSQVAVVPFTPALRRMLDYQLDIHNRVEAILSAPNSRVIIQMPTGSGKTLTAMNILATFLRTRHRHGAAARILWLAHSEELLEQAVGAFEEIWLHVGDREIPVYRSWGKFPLPMATPTSAVVAATFQKANAVLKKGPPGWQADVIVVDEAHRALAPTFELTMERMRASSGRVIGLTATPGRAMRDGGENERLAALFGGEIVGLEIGEEGVIEELQKRGVLAIVKRDPLDLGFPIDLPNDEWKRLTENAASDFSPEFLRSLALNRHRNLTIIEKLKAVAANGEQTLYFATSVAQSKIIAAALLANGVEAAHIDGSTPAEVRRLRISQFRSGAIRVLCNFGVLSTGFDAPATNCVFIARPTTSIVLYSQMIGRGLRGPAIGGKAVCHLVQVRDNFLNLPVDLDEIYEFFADYWE